MGDWSGFVFWKILGQETRTTEEEERSFEEKEDLEDSPRYSQTYALIAMRKNPLRRLWRILDNGRWLQEECRLGRVQKLSYLPLTVEQMEIGLDPDE